MKKVLVLLFALIFAAGFVTAQDSEGAGLSAGLEFGIGNVAEDGGREPYLMPMLVYGNAFFGGALDVSAELDYTFTFTKTPDPDDGKEVFPQSLYFDAALGYNFFLNDTSTLSVLLENENDAFILSPRGNNETIGNGVLIPGVKFNLSAGFGDLYAEAGVPLYYVQEGPKDQEFGFDLDFTLGWASVFGLGLEISEHTAIKPEAGYAGLDVIVSYENGPCYAEVEVDTYDTMESGITVIPEFAYALSGFTFYVNCTFEGIAAGSDDIVVSPALGVTYSF